MRVNRYDLVSAGDLKAPVRTPEGWLRVDGKIARVGVQDYQQPDGSVRRELRLPEEVFHADAMASLGQVPVCNQHPPKLLDATDARKFAVGALGDVRPADETWLAGSLLVHDAATIGAIESGRSQLSVGYSCELDTRQDPALTKRWGEYDAIQRAIRGNHLAIVDRARAGADARLRLDAADAIAVQPKEPTMKTVKVGGVEIDADKPELIQHAVERLDRQVAEARPHSKQAKKDLCDVCDGEGHAPCGRCEGLGTMNPEDGVAKCDACDGLGWVGPAEEGEEEEKADNAVALAICLAAKPHLDTLSDRELAALSTTEVMRRVLAKLEVRLDGSPEYLRGAFDAATALQKPERAMSAAERLRVAAMDAERRRAAQGAAYANTGDAVTDNMRAFAEKMRRLGLPRKDAK